MCVEKCIVCVCVVLPIFRIENYLFLRANFTLFILYLVQNWEVFHSACRPLLSETPVVAAAVTVTVTLLLL